MSMTRKDYVMLAGAVKDRVTNTRLLTNFGWSYGEMTTALLAIRDLAEHLADQLHRDNPRFEQDRFLKDCGVL